MSLRLIQNRSLAVKGVNASPTIRLIDRAIESARYGSVREYLVQSANSASAVNERTLRNGFSDLRNKASRSHALLEAHEMMRALNGYYRTRYAIGKLEALVPIVYETISHRDWWHDGPPDIAHASTSDIEGLRSIVPAVLRDAEKAQLNRPYSLVTKFLHFCFPNSFGIYDAQAANSIQTWGFFVFDLDDPAGKKFAQGQIADPNGRGYGAIIEFYRFCWEYATEEQITNLELAAQELSSEIHAPVSPTYIIDNLIWHSNGDPRILGLL